MTDQQFTKSVNLVPCDSDQAAIFVYDAPSGHLVLQTNASYPPDGYPPIIPDTGVGPGEGEKGIGSELNSSVTSNEETETEPSATLPRLCLDVIGGSVEDGAVLTLAPCANDDEEKEGSGGDHQMWDFYEVEGGAGEGSLVSRLTGQCVTAGWPFFTGAAFEMNKESRNRYSRDYAVVLLNEAEEPVEFDMSFPAEGFVVKAVIGPRSIQTIIA